ncbi:MAG: metallophosphoesterase, partial [Nitrososphaerales archaeon]
MKIAILGDCHFGVRNGAESFDRYFEKFFSDIFFPHLINNNITTVIQVGDIFDNRKTIHINSISRSTEFFFRKFEEYGIRLIILVGNHDSFYKDTIKINSPKLLLQNKFNNIKIIDEPTDILLNDIDVTLLPWICKDNYNNTMEL